MTVDEFGKYLAELNHRVTHFYEYEKTQKDIRQETAKSKQIKLWESKYDKT